MEQDNNNEHDEKVDKGILLIAKTIDDAFARLEYDVSQCKEKIRLALIDLTNIPAEGREEQ